MSKYDKSDPRIWKSPKVEETSLDAFYLHNNTKNSGGKKETPDKKEKKEGKTTEEEKKEDKNDKCKKSCSRRYDFVNKLAFTAAAAGVVLSGITIYEYNTRCITVEQAEKLGWNVEEDLAIPKDVYRDLNMLNVYIKNKSKIDIILDAYINNAEDILACKIAELFKGIEPNDVYLKYGLPGLCDEPVGYIQIGDTIYTKDEGENMYKADSKIIDCIENIVMVQGIQEYCYDSPLYSAENDYDKIYEKAKDAVVQLDQTAACKFMLDKNGNIIAETIKGRPTAKDKNDEPEIGD